ncbi:MAG: carbon storage regulator [Anaerolineales bacterium]|nr:carbon storage regulator [Anaerolineales bacterium]
MALVLTRREGETLLIGKDIRVTVVEIDGRQVRIAVEAPPEVKIWREEMVKDGRVTLE